MPKRLAEKTHHDEYTYISGASSICSGRHTEIQYLQSGWLPTNHMIFPVSSFHRNKRHIKTILLKASYTSSPTSKDSNEILGPIQAITSSPCVRKFPSSRSSRLPICYRSLPSGMNGSYGTMLFGHIPAQEHNPPPSISRQRVIKASIPASSLSLLRRIFKNDPLINRQNAHDSVQE